ncbi:MAG: hypothetical protein GXX90_06195 [Microbacteriaceae bacterium]|nr:hypothetical protein [Microbacteriaceae bacterium]
MRIGFLVVALAGVVWAIASQWDEILAALVEMSPTTIAIGAVLAIVFVLLTMLSWRAVLADLGSPLRLVSAGRLFFVSQLGKYVPGGVWNYVAVVEMGATRSIPRARSLSAMVVSIMVSIVTAALVAVPGLVTTGRFPIESGAWLLVLVPVVAVMLVPAVLNRLIAFALKLVKRPPLEHPLPAGGVALSAGWALAAWIVSGVMVWLLCLDFGMPASFETFVLAVGGYALSWAMGFVVFFVPAGLGVREAVLAVMLAGHLEPGALIVVILMARIFATLGDVVLGLIALAVPEPKVHSAD